MLYNDFECWKEILEWVEAAKVAHTMAFNRLGCMGHYYSGMLDIYSDLTQQYRFFGGHIELIEVDELADLRRAVTDEEIEGRVQLFHSKFDVQPDCSGSRTETRCTYLCCARPVSRSIQAWFHGVLLQRTGNDR